MSFSGSGPRNLAKVQRIRPSRLSRKVIRMRRTSIGTNDRPTRKMDLWRVTTWPVLYHLVALDWSKYHFAEDVDAERQDENTMVLDGVCKVLGKGRSR